MIVSISYAFSLSNKTILKNGLIISSEKYIQNQNNSNDSNIRQIIEDNNVLDNSCQFQNQNNSFEPINLKAKTHLNSSSFAPFCKQSKKQSSIFNLKDVQSKLSDSFSNQDLNKTSDFILKKIVDNLKTGLALFDQKFELVYSNKFIEKQVKLSEQDNLAERILQMQIKQGSESKNQQQNTQITSINLLNLKSIGNQKLPNEDDTNKADNIEIQINPNIKSTNFIQTQCQLQSQKGLVQLNYLDCKNSILVNDQNLNRKKQQSEFSFTEKFSSLKQQIIQPSALDILKRKQATTLQDLIQIIFQTQEKNELQRFRTSSRIQEQNAYHNDFESYEDINLQRNLIYFEDRNDLIILLQNKGDIDNGIQWLKIGLYQGKKVNSNNGYYILIEFCDNTALLRNISQNEIFEYKNRMIASISHELRTPLNCSIQMLNLFIKNFEEQKDEERADIQKTIEMLIKPALNSNYILLNIINDILDYAQINTGDFQLTFTPLSLFELVTECIEMVCYQAALKEIQIEVSFDTNLPEYIHSDYNRIRQVILNLLCNSLKFTQKGFIRVFFALESPKLIRADVSDTGCGISEDDIKEIFEAFGNKLNQKHLNTKGAGFGLTISNNLAMGLGGNRKMMVKSKINEGSTFSFYIIDRDLDKTGCKYKLKDLFNQQVIKWESCTKIESKSNFAKTNQRQSMLNIMKSYHLTQDYSKQKPEFNYSNSFVIDSSQLQNNMSPDPYENQMSKQYSKQSTITLSFVPKITTANSKSSYIQMSSSFNNNNNNNNQSQTEGSFQKLKQKINYHEANNYSSQKIQENNPEQTFLSQKSKDDKLSIIFQQSFLVIENQLDKKIESCQIIEENSSLNFKTNNTDNLQLRKQYFQECDPTSPNIYSLPNKMSHESSVNDQLFSQIKGKRANQMQKTRMLQEMKQYNYQQEKEKQVSTIPQLLNKQNADKKCECSQILIVDDNDFNLYSLQLILKTYGFIVDKSNSGMDAVSKVKLKYSNQSCCQYYQLIFMDIDMPIMDGHQTTTEIIKFYKNQQSSFQPIISACSAYVQDSEKQKAFKKGMRYYITKPINTKQLEQILANEFLNQNMNIK
ncbi:hypothetical protein ABPG74_001452 [Tetrahymena malaccensis]